MNRQKMGGEERGNGGLLNVGVGIDPSQASFDVSCFIFDVRHRLHVNQQNAIQKEIVT